ncbi:MAG TPA: hypothetical protein DD725_09095 [Deltaproteobacteria bacterium]|nr:hypothetical protein [Deltaproteobacteria bacterium]
MKNCRNNWFYWIVLFMLISPAFSIADELSDLKKKVDQQQKEIDELRQDLERLEQSESSGESMAVKPMFGANLGLFGDINFTTNSREKSKSSFYIGEADLYSTANYGDRLTFLTEIAIEGDGQGFELDLERLWVGYTFNDLLIVRAGKHHTALGHWNKTYHHGKQFFLTVDRPFFMAFEHDGGVLPVHITGMEFEGRWTYDFARFKYEFNVGNGPRINQSTMILAQNNVSDDNSSKQIALRISGRPNVLGDLNIGVFGTIFTVDTTQRSDLDEKIYGIDVEYTHNKFELLTEYFRLANSDAASSAFYAQVGYNIVEDVTPYVRFESLNRDGDDPYLSNLEGGFDRRQVIAGVKYDIDVVKSSIKTQYRYDDTDNGNDYNVFEAQWSFGF